MQVSKVPTSKRIDIKMWRVELIGEPNIQQHKVVRKSDSSVWYVRTNYQNDEVVDCERIKQSSYARWFDTKLEAETFVSAKFNTTIKMLNFKLEATKKQFAKHLAAIGVTIINADSENGWITCVINGRWIEAKVYDEPSTYGVNNGRVSKLSIAKTHNRDMSSNYIDQLDYNYDRGLDFSNLDEAFVNDIILQLEAITSKS